MQKIDFVMGMPIIMDAPHGHDQVFKYFREIDERFSPYKANSEVSQINKSQDPNFKYSKDMKEILRLAEKTKQETNGYFDIYRDNPPKGEASYMDPSGIVKGWAIYNASKILDKKGVKKYYINAGGDIQTKGGPWAVGIRNPFNVHENVKIVYLNGEGIATSGTYEKGSHIYDPYSSPIKFENLRISTSSPDLSNFTSVQNGNSRPISLTVIGPNVYEADRFVTAAFAIGAEGINFVEKQKGLEGYMIDIDGIGTMTSGFEKYVEAHR